MIIRKAEPADAKALWQISNSIADGMTTMPKELSAWETKLKKVDETMQSDYSMEQGLYFLVLEDPNTGELLGTASIQSGVGKDRPFYTYKLTKHVRASAELGIQINGDMLNLVNDFTGDTELGSLFLKPECRGSGVGKTIAAARIMMIGEFPQRFGGRIFAEIRGWLDDNGESPFWEGLGKKFFNLSYAEADTISALRGVQFISDLMPRLPIYLELLPPSAIDVIGIPHKDSSVAMKYLLNEGFQYQGSVDIFDAGPVLECAREHIRSLEKIASYRLERIFSEGCSSPDNSEKNSTKYLVSNGDLSRYRITTAIPDFLGDGAVGLSRHVANELQLELGQSLNMLRLGE